MYKMMHKYVKKVIGLTAIGMLATSTIFGVFATNTGTTMTILGGTITIGAPTSLNFTSTLTTALVAQTLSQSFNTNFTGYFYVLDVQGADT